MERLVNIFILAMYWNHTQAPEKPRAGFLNSSMTDILGRKILFFRGLSSAF